MIIFSAKCFAYEHIVEGKELPELPEVPDFVKEYQYYFVFVKNNDWSQVIYSNEHEPVHCDYQGYCGYTGPCEVLTYYYSKNAWDSEPVVYEPSVR